MGSERAAPIELARARELVRERIVALSGVERVARDAALDRVLAEPLVAPRDVPGFAHSAMDGYAVRGMDLLPDAPTRLREIGARLAGRAGPESIAEGECVRVTTGAALPAGADTVVIVENSRRDGATIELASGTVPGANVRAADDDYARGALAAGAGTRLAPAHLGVAAEFGLRELAVRPRVRIALLVTGDELVEPGAALGHGQRFESNGTLLDALARAHGAAVASRAHVGDDPDRTREALRAACAAADLVITSGGVSAGEADYVPGAVAALGEIVFWKVRMRPGLPALFGLVDRTPVFALPGNPVSVFATFLALVRPALAALTGCAALDPPPLHVRLEAMVEKRHARLELRRASLTCGDDAVLRARAHPVLSSGALRSVAESDVLIELAADRERFRAGDVVRAMRFAP